MESIRDRTVQGERKKTKIANGVYCGKKSQGKIRGHTAYLYDVCRLGRQRQ